MIPRGAKKLFVLLCVVITYIWLMTIIKKSYAISNHSEYVNQFYSKRERWNTSNLGAILFKNKSQDVFQQYNKTKKSFTILVWKYFDWLQNRHIKGFNSLRKDPLDQCSVKNCKFVANANISDVDVLLVHLQHGIIPRVTRRNTSQRWVFLTDESPRNVFSLADEKPDLAKFRDVFNWSMSYRIESDVPVPYGRTVPLETSVFLDPSIEDIKSLIPNWATKQRDTFVTVLMSNCVPFRMMFLRELQKHLAIDIYGHCSTNFKTICPGSFRSRCNSVSKYLFYLVIENSICDQYLSEKAFYHAYAQGAIPIIIGPSIQECTAILPPKSFLHLDSFENMQQLVNEIESIARNEETLLSFHKWRNDFQILNEHGFFDTTSYHYCRLCQALNFNEDETKVYDRKMLSMYLEPQVSCRSSSIRFSSQSAAIETIASVEISDNVDVE